VGTLRKGQSTRTIRTSEVLPVLKDFQVKEEAKLISHELHIENKGENEINILAAQKKRTSQFTVKHTLV
jgi:hypothetical protein